MYLFICRLTFYTHSNLLIYLQANKIRRRLSTRTALVMYNDEAAYKIINEFNKMGIRIPEDISIVGIDDTPLNVNGSVQISSVTYPTQEIADKTARNMLELIKDGRFNATYEFDVNLAERESVKTLPKAKINNIL